MHLEPGQQRYIDDVRKRARRADAAVLSRVIGVQIAWSVSLVCGAAIALVQAIGQEISWLAGEEGWITAVLGFAVVIAQGAGRLFSRTSGVVQADDLLRRSLAREDRLFHALAGPYDGIDAPFELYVERVEAAIAAHDGEAAAYSASLLQTPD